MGTPCDPHLRDGGAITIPSGLLARQPTLGRAAVGRVNSTPEDVARVYVASVTGEDTGAVRPAVKR